MKGKQLLSKALNAARAKKGPSHINLNRHISVSLRKKRRPARSRRGK